METVIEIKGSAPTVTVSWEKNNEREGGDTRKRTNTSDQMIGSGRAVYKLLLYYMIYFLFLGDKVSSSTEVCLSSK